jgi:hypothetical protein
MARFDVIPIDSGELFPPVTLNSLRGDEVKVPNDLGQGYKVMLIYRGKW